jgi:acetoin utilization protein AcuB
MDLSRYDRMPPVGAAMTPFPYFVDATQSLHDVEQLMLDHGIRHVPVQAEGRVVGLVSEQGLHTVLRSRAGADAGRLLARDVMASDPLIVEIAAPLHHVVAEMAERRVGAAIVVKQGKLAGILSATDVCRVLAGILLESFPGSGDDAA